MIALFRRLSSDRRRVVAGAVALLAVVVVIWWWWPLTRDHEAIDVVVAGNGAVVQARDELERRLRQEGMVPQVVLIDAIDCSRLAAAIDDTGGRGDALVVLSLDDWSACAGLPEIDLLVQQPDGPLPVGLSASLGVRPAAPLFGSPVVSGTPGMQACVWWDTPGAGEDRPGLGKCGPDGEVQVLDDDGLTPAGSERFARLVVEAVK